VRTLIAVLAALILAVAVTLILQRQNGYVLVGYGHWTVEGSLALFLLLILLGFSLLYALVRTAVRVWNLPRGVHAWRERRLALRARKALTRGLVELAEGDWPSAEKSLVRLARHSEMPLLNYLAAARAAQAQGAHERRDHYLHRAHEAMPSADVAVSLTQAELQLAHQQLEQALATLMHLRGVAPRHGYVLRLLETLYERLGDWAALRDLLPELRRRKVESEARLRQLEIKATLGLLVRAAREPDPERLSRLWDGLPPALRDEPALLAEYARQQMIRGRGPVAEAVLREHLRKHWNEELIALLGLMDSERPERQLAAAEAWLERHPRNAVLLLTLGRLCLRARLWGKARGYLEASAGAGGGAQAYRALGGLLEQLGEPENALQCYRAGLELCTEAPSARSSAAPLPGAAVRVHEDPSPVPAETLVRPGYSA
jgi:HemY protein